MLQGGVLRKVLAGQIVTAGPDETVDPNRRAEALERVSVMNFSDSLMSAYPVGPGAISCLGFHRRKPRPPFSPRERLIVHLIVEQVDWLHRYGSNVSASNKVLRLSGRQRQVLLLLLAGNTQRQIALQIHISEHTVGEYVKECTAVSA